MQKWIFSCLMCSALFFSQQTLATETFTFDPAHSYVLYNINHLGFSNQVGKWFADGKLILDEKAPQNSKVNAIIHVGNPVTGDKELEEHLRSPAFFNTAKYPVATFVSTKVILTSKTTAKVMGILTLMGLSKPVTLNVVFNKVDVNPISNKKTVGFGATTEIKRSDFGNYALADWLSDKVKIDIEIEGVAE